MSKSSRRRRKKENRKNQLKNNSVNTVVEQGDESLDTLEEETDVELLTEVGVDSSETAPTVETTEKESKKVVEEEKKVSVKTDVKKGFDLADKGSTSFDNGLPLMDDSDIVYDPSDFEDSEDEDNDLGDIVSQGVDLDPDKSTSKKSQNDLIFGIEENDTIEPAKGDSLQDSVKNVFSGFTNAFKKGLNRRVSELAGDSDSSIAGDSSIGDTADTSETSVNLDKSENKVENTEEKGTDSGINRVSDLSDVSAVSNVSSVPNEENLSETTETGVSDEATQKGSVLNKVVKPFNDAWNKLLSITKTKVSYSSDDLAELGSELGSDLSDDVLEVEGIDIGEIESGIGVEALEGISADGLENNLSNDVLDNGDKNGSRDLSDTSGKLENGLPKSDMAIVSDGYNFDYLDGYDYDKEFDVLTDEDKEDPGKLDFLKKILDFSYLVKLNPFAVKSSNSADTSVDTDVEGSEKAELGDNVEESIETSESLVRSGTDVVLDDNSGNAGIDNLIEKGSAESVEGSADKSEIGENGVDLSGENPTIFAECVDKAKQFLSKIKGNSETSETTEAPETTNSADIAETTEAPETTNSADTVGTTEAPNTIEAPSVSETSENQTNSENTIHNPNENDPENNDPENKEEEKVPTLKEDIENFFGISLGPKKDKDGEKPSEEDKKKKTRNKVIWSVAAAFVLLCVIFASMDNEPQGGSLSYIEFMNDLEMGYIESVIYTSGNAVSEVIYKEGVAQEEVYDPETGDVKELEIRDGKRIETVLNPSDDEFFKTISLKGADVKIASNNLSNFIIMLIGAIPTILLIVFLVILMKMQFGGMGNKPTVASKISTTKFADVAGMTEEKDELMFAIRSLQNQEEYVAKGVKPVKGILLEGPPGVGKTLLAKAVAGEAGVHFLSYSGSDFVEMFVGLGARRIREMFTIAEKVKPCVIFIDEIDALGRKRTSGGNNGGLQEADQTLIALLERMDGMNSTSGILFIAATNRVDALDNALLRPGRFDKTIHVSPPKTREDREAVVRVHSKDKSFDESVTIEKIAKQCYGLTGAEIAAALNDAVLESFKADRNGIVKLEDIDKAIMKLFARGLAKGKHSEKDLYRVSVHEVGHAMMDKELGRNVVKVSIQPYSSGVGGVTQIDGESSGLDGVRTKSDIINDVKVLYAGKIAEETLLDECSIGASNDLERATYIIRDYVAAYGMDKRSHLSLVGLGRENVLVSSNEKLLGRMEEVAGEIYESVETYFNDPTNKAILEDISKKLAEDEVIYDFDEAYLDSKSFIETGVRIIKKKEKSSDLIDLNKESDTSVEQGETAETSADVGESSETSKTERVLIIPETSAVDNVEGSDIGESFESPENIEAENDESDGLSSVDGKIKKLDEYDRTEKRSPEVAFERFNSKMDRISETLRDGLGAIVKVYGSEEGLVDKASAEVKVFGKSVDTAGLDSSEIADVPDNSEVDCGLEDESDLAVLEAEMQSYLGSDDSDCDELDPDEVEAELNRVYDEDIDPDECETESGLIIEVELERGSDIGAEDERDPDEVEAEMNRFYDEDVDPDEINVDEYISKMEKIASQKGSADIDTDVGSAEVVESSETAETAEISENSDNLGSAEVVESPETAENSAESENLEGDNVEVEKSRKKLRVTFQSGYGERGYRGHRKMTYLVHDVTDVETNEIICAEYEFKTSTIFKGKGFKQGDIIEFEANVEKKDGQIKISYYRNVVCVQKAPQEEE